MCYSDHKIQDSEFFFAGPFLLKILLYTSHGERL